MKKFKIKNRQKRKYIKRNSPVSTVSLSRSLFIRVMPYILIAIGFLTTFFIGPHSYQPIHPIDLHLNPPTVPSLSLQTSIQALQQLFAAFLTTLTATIQTISDGTSQTGSQATDIVSTFFLTLERGLAHTFLALLWLTHQTIAFWDNLATQMKEFLFYEATIIGGGIGHISFVILHEAIIILSSLIHVLQQLIYALFTIVQTTLHGIGLLLAKLWNIVLLPFRVMASWYQQIKPYVDFVINSFKESATYLANSFQLLFQVAQDASQK